MGAMKKCDNNATVCLTSPSNQFMPLLIQNSAERKIYPHNFFLIFSDNATFSDKSVFSRYNIFKVSYKITDKAEF